jgi:hypothetical protein
MANIITVLLILAVVFKIVDVSALTWLDYVIFALILAYIVSIAIQWAKGRKR